MKRWLSDFMHDYGDLVGIFAFYVLPALACIGGITYITVAETRDNNVAARECAARGGVLVQTVGDGWLAACVDRAALVTPEGH